MTSNIGSQHILHESDPQRAAQQVKGALREHFRPEFLNRIDAQIVFSRLDETIIRQIVDIQLQSAHRLLANRGLTLEFDDAAKDLLARVGYDPAFGARPLKRTIRELVLEPLSEMIIAGQIPPESCIRATAEGDCLRLIPVSNEMAVN